MGYFKHHSIIVTSVFKNDIDKARITALQTFKELNGYFDEKYEDLVTEIFEGIANRQYTFFIIPDGSKEGWTPSDLCNTGRDLFLKWMEENDTGCNYVEVIFGGDDDYCEITKKDK